jgi:hypothetical protein
MFAGAGSILATVTKLLAGAGSIFATVAKLLAGATWQFLTSRRLYTRSRVSSALGCDERDRGQAFAL